DIQSTLRRLDEEIVGHKQQIARSQVEIARLQDTRMVLMRLAEDDIAHAEAERAERAGMIAGEHAKPVLIVRKTTEEPKEQPKGKTVHARANGATKTAK